MDCGEFKKNISKYILDDLEPDLKEAFEEHYFGCQKCFQQLELKDALASLIRKNGVEGILGHAPEVDRVEALVEYAEAATKLGDHEEAVRLFKKALELAPDDNRIFAKLKQTEQKAQGTDKEYILEVEPEDWLKNFREARRDRVKFGEFVDDLAFDLPPGWDLDPSDIYTAERYNQELESNNYLKLIPAGNFKNWMTDPERLAVPVPEPATLSLFGTGLVGLAASGIRKKRAKEQVTESATEEVVSGLLYMLLI